MSTKSKRRVSRRHQVEQGEPRSAPGTTVAKGQAQEVAGEIVGQLLNAITFGATESPQSVRSAKQ